MHESSSAGLGCSLFMLTEHSPRVLFTAEPAPPSQVAPIHDYQVSVFCAAAVPVTALTVPSRSTDFQSCMQTLLDQLCTLGAAGAPLLVEAYGAGGDRARQAFAAVEFAQCPGDPSGQAVLDAWNVVKKSKEFNDPSTAWR